MTIGIARLRRNVGALMMCGLLVASCRAEREDVNKSDARLLAAASSKEDGNWLSHGRTYDETRFSPLTQIDGTNAGKLGLAWYADLDTFRGQEGTPLVVDGVMYATTAWSKVVALDAATGQHLWEYDPKVPGTSAIHACCDVVNRGAAYSNGRLFFGTVDGRLIALDAKSGRQLWRMQTTDAKKPMAISGAPRVARGKVFIGFGGADQGMRGYISAYDERTGRLVWRFYTVPGKPGEQDGAASDDVLERLAGPTWAGDWWKIGGGGTAWDSIVYDETMNRLYVGVGNGGPWNRGIRSAGRGDNLFIGSILALDPDTGRYLWHYQETPGDQWDFTSTQQMTLAELPIGGRPRKVILHAPKNGFFYVIDRETGKPLSADKFVPVNWASHVDLKSGRPQIDSEARYDRSGQFIATSGPWGAHNWHPMAFSPQTGLIYIPAQQIPSIYTPDGAFRYRPGLLNMGLAEPGKLPQDKAAIEAMLKSFEGRLIAWDPVARKEVWRVPYKGPWNGGVLATGGNLVFQGDAQGLFHAYDARAGKQRWKFDAQAPIMAGPVSYAVDGTQYVAVMAGKGGAYNLAMPSYAAPQARLPGRILAFRIGGTARLPERKNSPPAPFAPSQESFAPQQVAQGEHLYSATCGVCHGSEGLSSGVLPDLRRSGAIADVGVFRQVVLEGILANQGMVSFREYLSPQDAEAIRAYINHQARKAKAKGEE